MTQAGLESSETLFVSEVGGVRIDFCFIEGVLTAASIQGFALMT